MTAHLPYQGDARFLGNADISRESDAVDGDSLPRLSQVQGLIAGLSSQTLSVHADSAGLIEIDGDEIKIKSLLRADVFRDGDGAGAGYASLDAWIGGGHYTGSEVQVGDTVILNDVPDGEGGFVQRLYIHHGGNSGTSADFTLYDGPDLNVSAVRAMFGVDANGLITYSTATGVFGLEPSTIRALFAGAGKISIDGNGTISLSALEYGDLATSLQLLIDGKASQADMDTANAAITTNATGIQANTDAIAAMTPYQTTIASVDAHTWIDVVHNKGKDRPKVRFFLGYVEFMAPWERVDSNTVRFRVANALSDVTVEVCGC